MFYIKVLVFLFAHFYFFLHFSPQSDAVFCNIIIALYHKINNRFSSLKNILIFVKICNFIFKYILYIICFIYFIRIGLASRKYGKQNRNRFDDQEPKECCFGQIRSNRRSIALHNCRAPRKE